MTSEKKRRSGGNAEGRGGSVLVMSNRRISAAGCRGIAEYSDTRVRITLRELELTVDGVGLTVRIYCGDEIEVRGRVDAVIFGNCVEKERER